MINPLRQASGIFQTVLKASCIVAVFAMWLAAVLVYGASVLHMITSIVFFALYVQIPGLFIVDYIGFRKIHISTNIILGFFVGWILNLVVYFISDAIPTDILMYVVPLMFSCAYFYQLHRKSNKHQLLLRINVKNIPSTLYIFLATVLFYCLVSVQYKYMSPDLSQYTLMNSDKAYHIGLINSLSHDYPLISPWVHDRVIHYHIFSELLLSIPVRLFSVPSDFALLSFGPFLTTYTFGLSLYSFYREMSGHPNRAALYCLITFCANMFTARSYYNSLALTFALENDNATGYGIAATLVTILVFKKWYDSLCEGDKFSLRQLILLVFMVMLTTGIKGPMGAVIIAALWGTFILGFIMRKIKLSSVLPLLIITSGFIIVYMTILTGRGLQNGSGSSLFAFATITNISFWKQWLISILESIGISRFFRLLAILFVFTILFFSIFFIPFVIGYIRELILIITGRKMFEPHKVLVYAAAAVGFLLMMVMHYSGHSQVYFGLVTVYLAPIISFWFIEDLEIVKDKSALAARTLKFTVAIMTVCLIVTTLCLSILLVKRMDNAIKTATISNKKPDKYLTISNDEYDAMIWLSENTPKDALLATDRYYSVPLSEYSYDNRWANRFFLYAVYSNRFTYISGSGYNLPGGDWPVRKKMIETNLKLYDALNEERGDLARELGVDYVVVSKRFTNVGDLSNKDYEKCFTNDDIDIYKIAG